MRPLEAVCQELLVAELAVVAVSASVPTPDGVVAAVPLTETTDELDMLATPVALSIPVEL